MTKPAHRKAKERHFEQLLPQIKEMAEVVFRSKSEAVDFFARASMDSLTMDDIYGQLLRRYKGETTQDYTPT